MWSMLLSRTWRTSPPTPPVWSPTAGWSSSTSGKYSRIRKTDRQMPVGFLRFRGASRGWKFLQRLSPPHRTAFPLGKGGPSGAGRGCRTSIFHGDGLLERNLFSILSPCQLRRVTFLPPAKKVTKEPGSGEDLQPRSRAASPPSPENPSPALGRCGGGLRRIFALQKCQLPLTVYYGIMGKKEIYCCLQTCCCGIPAMKNLPGPEGPGRTIQLRMGVTGFPCRREYPLPWGLWTSWR